MAAKNLVIVESPAKAKTIGKYLGSDFTVLSSVGHIRSIPKKTKGGKEPIDIGNGFLAQYEVDVDKKKVIAELKKAVKTADSVWLATDEDREGEAIAWHLCEVLKLNPKTTKRIVFHEITQSAIEEAIRHPRSVDMHLVQAQQARQILDRLVGFELSPVVWQKVPGGKSAGRVQSPAVRLLTEREREIEAFKASSQFRVTAVFSVDAEQCSAGLTERFDREDQAAEFLRQLMGADFQVASVDTSPASRNPSAPFTTSTLQQEANARLGFGARATMASAQKLYQAGKITYMRTDSVTLSRQAIAAAAEYIEKKYGKEYLQVRAYKTKSASAQEAHEAIRPTDMALGIGSSDPYDQKLYELIRNRTLASQMAAAKLEKTIARISIGDQPARLVFEAKGEVIRFDGFLRVYGNKKQDTLLPPLHVGDKVELQSASARQLFAKPPARYTEGSLVKKLEDLGIGRPSTYATIINTIQVRGYAERGYSEGTERDVICLHLHGDKLERTIEHEKTGSTKGKLIPTAAGEVLSDFLTKHFEQVVDYGFTAHVEEEFDQIANNELSRNTMLQEFYEPFHDLVEKSGNIERSTVAKARLLGQDPKTNKPVYARIGRYGPLLQLGDTEDKAEKPQFAPLPAGEKLDTVSLEAAVKAFELPRLVGKTADGLEIKANIGRFGPYIQAGKLFVSIRGYDPHTISLAEALELYKAKQKAEAEKTIVDFGDGTKVLRGRFGPYVTDGKINAKVPKEVDPTSLTKAAAAKLLQDSPPTKRKPSRRRR